MHVPVPAVLLVFVHAAAIAVAVTDPGRHALAGLVVLTGLVLRWALRARRRRAPTGAAPVRPVLTADPVPPSAAPA